MAEDDILPTVRDLGIGFVAYSPLGRGFLTGEIRSPEDLGDDDFRRMSPRFQGDNFQQNLDLVERVKQVAGDKGYRQRSWRVASARRQRHCPDPGTKRRKYLEENVGAIDIALTPNDLSLIDDAAPKGATAGDRYPTALMGSLNR